MATDIPNIPDAEADLKAAVEKMKRSLPLLASMAQHVATARKANYEAHLKAGFTPAQALELCRHLS